MLSLSRQDSTLLVIDMQSRLVPAIDGSEQLLKRTEALLRAARLLDVPVLATEHCADKIGPTLPLLRPWIQGVMPKTHFSAAREPGFLEFLPPARRVVLLVGTEAHVCVLQTALGLLAQGYQPVLVADCVGSRHALDYQLALTRCGYNQIPVVSSEMIMFEWLESAQHPRFKEVLALIRAN